MSAELTPPDDWPEGGAAAAIDEGGPAQALAELNGMLGEPMVNFGAFSVPGVADLIEALACAQGEFEPIRKNRTAQIRSRDPSKPGYTFEYADMDSIRQSTQPALAKYGLAVTSLPVFVDGQRHLRTMVMRKGVYMYADLPIPSAGEGQITEVIKAFGGLLTYLRRYSVIALLNLSADNDLDEHDEPETFGRGHIDDEGPAVHPEMKSARSVAELSRIMGGLSKADKGKYSDYFNVRMQELKEAQP